MSNQIILTLKKEWFDKILSGEKSVEYREYKPYWQVRLRKGPTSILFRNGYSKNAPSITADIESIKVVDGKDTDLKIDYPVYAISLKNVEAKREASRG